MELTSMNTAASPARSQTTDSVGEEGEAVDLLDGQEGQSEGEQGSDQDDQVPLDARVIAQAAKDSEWVPHIVAACLANVLLWGRELWKVKGRLGEVCAIFCAFSARILIVPIWTLPFIPVLSPVYGHGPVWAASTWRSALILCHVLSGIAMLALASLQFDVSSRRRYPVLHRLSGYSYVVLGLACVGALQGLRQTVALEHGLVETSFIEVASLLWLVSTILAVRAARKRDFETHKRWMVRSVACALSPLAQRLANFVLCPLFMWLRLSLSGLYAVSCMNARWGEGAGSSLALGFALPPAIDNSIALLRNASSSSSSAPSSSSWLDASFTASSSSSSWEDWLNVTLQAALGSDEVQREIDHRFPAVISRDGYGVAEQLVFPASSWLGLVVALLLAELQPSARASMASSLTILRVLFKPDQMMAAAQAVLRAGKTALSYSFCQDKVALVPESVPRAARITLGWGINVTLPLLVALLLPLFLLSVLLVCVGASILVLCFGTAFLAVGIWAFEFAAAIGLSLPFYIVGVILRLASGGTVEEIVEEEFGL